MNPKDHERGLKARQILRLLEGDLAEHFKASYANGMLSTNDDAERNLVAKEWKAWSRVISKLRAMSSNLEIQEQKK